MTLAELKEERKQLYTQREQKIRELGISEGAIQTVEFLIKKELEGAETPAAGSEVKA